MTGTTQAAIHPDQAIPAAAIEHPAGLDRMLSRRELLEGGVRLGVGVALVGALPLLAGCDVDGQTAAVHHPGATVGSSADLLSAGSRPAPEAEILLAPYRVGDLIDEQYRLVGVSRAADAHLRLHLKHVRRGGNLEVELFRRDATQTRPIAATARWEMYSFNTAGAGPVDTPAHVKDAISQVALLIAVHEDDADMVELSGTVCSFADRGTPPQPV